VVRICHALDGMPLAIELAAARLRMMTPESLADRLNDRFAVLTGGNRTALPRHRTLRAVVDWSWELTSDAERRLWRRLSVFAGGATLDAVENVCGGDFDTLTALADKSLVIVRDEQAGSRFHLLETIKAYGQMRLDEAGERDAVRAAHADYFRGLAAAARERLHGSEQLEWFAALEADHDNLNAAIRHAIATADVATADEMVGDLGWYWWIRGHRRDGLDLVVAALAVPDPDAETRPARATAFTIGALLAVDGTHDLALALQFFDAAYEMVQRLGRLDDPLLRLVTPLRTLFRSFSTDEHVDVDDFDLPVDDPYPWVAATALTMRAHTMQNFGRTGTDAVEDFRAALRIFRDLGERWGTSFALSSLSMVAAWRGDFDEAIGYLDEALRSVTELGVWEDRIQVRVYLVQALWMHGDRDRARAELATAMRDATRFGAPEARGQVYSAAADVARLSGDLVDARTYLERARAAVVPHSVAPQFHAVMTSQFGFLAAAEGDIAEARRQHRAALELSVSSVDAPVIAQALVGLADLALVDGDATRAATLVGAGTAVRGAPDWSLPDSVRVVEQAKAALGAAPYEAAYERGVRMSLADISELAGIAMPEQFASRRR
jgi:tetratricopeptide (TPR) repeat protein